MLVDVALWAAHAAFLCAVRAMSSRQASAACLGDDGIASETMSVHPAGNPMSHSRNWGFKGPPITAARPSPLLGDAPFRL